MNSMSLINYRSCIKADLFRYCGSTKIKDFFLVYRKHPGFKFSFWMRTCFYSKKNFLGNFFVFPFSYIFYNHFKYKYGIDISYASNIGPGLLIYHFGGIVVAVESAGKNLTVSQCTTIGMTIKDGIKKFPNIGDGVYLAPGSKVIGGITVGNNVAVGSNCVLNKSVVDDAVVVGIPGKVISRKGAYEYVNFPIE